MALIGSLGYVRVRATDMDAWRKFAFETIGFAEGSGPEPGALYLRMDERPGRIILLPGDEDRVGTDGMVVDETCYTAEEITADSYWGHRWDFT